MKIEISYKCKNDKDFFTFEVESGEGACYKTNTQTDIWIEVEPTIKIDGNEISTVRLLELATAEREGRVVVLPCKIGTMVYEVAKTVSYGYPDPNYEIKIYAKFFGFADIGAFGKSIFMSRKEADQKKAEAERALAEKGDAT